MERGIRFRVRGSGFRVMGYGLWVVVAASPRIYMGRCLKAAFKLQVTSHSAPPIPSHSSLLSNFGVRDYGSGFAALYMCGKAATTTLNPEPESHS